MNLSARELSLQSNTNVLGYIQAQNAKRDAQAKAEGWEFWTNMAEDIASEFPNAYELELSFARGAYADAYKDWCGIKGRVSEYLTLEEVEAEIAEIAEWAAEEYETAKEWQAEQDRMDREDIAMGLAEPTPETVLEEWEVYEAKAEEEGY